jgi:hypothetical protein
LILGKPLCVLGCRFLVFDEESIFRIGDDWNQATCVNIVESRESSYFQSSFVSERGERNNICVKIKDGVAL